ncbi:MAG: hypothetical protein Q8M65_02925 [Rhodoglobus sp.]|nr:hypothetical protein [Rhodoglobus sp.]
MKPNPFTHSHPRDVSWLPSADATINRLTAQLSVARYAVERAADYCTQGVALRLTVGSASETTITLGHLSVRISAHPTDRAGVMLTRNGFASSRLPAGRRTEKTTPPASEVEARAWAVKLVDDAMALLAASR